MQPKHSQTSVPVPLFAAQCTPVNSTMYEESVLRHTDSWASPKSRSNSWKNSFLHVAITSSFWGRGTFHQMLNKFKYCMRVFLLQEVAAYTNMHIETLAPTRSSPSLSNVSSVVFWAQWVLSVSPTGTDYKVGLIPQQKNQTSPRGRVDPATLSFY